MSQTQPALDLPYELRRHRVLVPASQQPCVCLACQAADVLEAVQRVLDAEPVEVPSGIESIGESAVGAFNLGVDLAMNKIREALGQEPQP